MSEDGYFTEACPVCGRMIYPDEYCECERLSARARRWRLLWTAALLFSVSAVATMAIMRNLI